MVTRVLAQSILPWREVLLFDDLAELRWPQERLVVLCQNWCRVDLSELPLNLSVDKTV